ncbi:hypothetical protein CBER1_01042 [Cercospora berteroae]|uniref:MARVEL domain-containing protein n=1 Tax=Cercospora berteroae TaxID=357750 RepID=A0A2S6C357_9PEZI|nr:hypothetical protein CBER1_01042 [Cercospora berteroae]
MGLVKGGALRFFQTFLYALAFACAAVILGIFSYFLATIADRNGTIFTWVKAVEGISGAAVLYTICAVVFTCCLGGISFFAFVAIVLDIAFVGGMIAIAVLTRYATDSCTGIVTTPLGTFPALSTSDGFGGEVTYQVSQRTACRLQKACFAVAVIGAFLFLVTAAMQIVLVRHHKKEKRYGPSPSNNYTSGFGKRKFWQRKPKNATRDAEMAGGAGGLAVPANPNNRASYDTGTTVGNNAAVHDKVDNTTYAPQPATSHSGYYTQPTGTGVSNPYGTTGTATNY